MSKQPRSPSARSELTSLIESDTTRRYGPKCVTCNHKQVVRIEELALELLRAREARETYYPWASLVSKLLKPKYGYEHSALTLKRHLENCLGKTIV